MNILFGFGQYHVDLTKDLAKQIAIILKCRNEDTIKDQLNVLKKLTGTFKDKGWPYLRIKTIHCWKNYKEHFGCTVEFMHTHYRDDHPMSPDGYASFSIDVSITYQNDDSWGERIYISEM